MFCVMENIIPLGALCGRRLAQSKIAMETYSSMLEQCSKQSSGSAQAHQFTQA
jgi:hypothetical protein